MAKNRFEYNMEGIKEGGRDVKQKRQGEAIGKKPTGDTGARFNADPRLPKKKKTISYGRTHGGAIAMTAKRARAGDIDKGRGFTRLRTKDGISKPYWEK